MENNHSDMLKHVLCGALIHLDAIGHEIKKLYLKENPEDNSSEIMNRAKILHLTMIAINDIIHPAHGAMYEFFKGNEEHFDALCNGFARAKKDGLAFKGCMCPMCHGSTSEVDKG